MIDFRDVNEILKKYSSGGYYYGDIPEKKERNARSYMNIPSSENVFALNDTTFFGSAKEGTCFTEKKIYGRNGSDVESISYDGLAKANVSMQSGLIYVNGTFPAYASCLSSLILAIHNLGAPINLTDAKNALNSGNYKNCIDLLNAQESRIKNTPEKDIISYRKLYIDAYIGSGNFAKAESLLEKFEIQYGSEDTQDFISDAESKIAAYHEQFEKDFQALKAGLIACKNLVVDEKYEEAANLLYSQNVRDDFSDDIITIYHKTKIFVEILNETPDKAEASINRAYDTHFIYSSEKDTYLERVAKIRDIIYERYVNEQKDILDKQIQAARMFEKHGILESASDTINAAISAAPSDINSKKVEAFKILVELLLAQFEYDQIYELRDFYGAISKDSLLGYSLREKVENHRATHVDEYYSHLYEKAIYYMQTAKFKDAHKYIDEAKAVKNTFDVRCAEINLAMLEFKYAESRSLLDALKKDKNRYTDSVVDDSIEHFENQYKEMVTAISEMLKIYAINNNIEAALANRGYDGFVDLDGLNLPSIASRFANHDIIDALHEKGYNCVATRFLDGFGIAFLAAMELNYEAFAKFIHLRIEFSKEFNSVINETLGIVYPVTDKIQAVCAEKGINEEKATDIVIKDLYAKCISFIAILLNPDYFEAVCEALEKEKEKQCETVERMKAELPAMLKRIEEECEGRQTQLRAAVDSMKSFVLDVPDSRSDKAEDIVSVLDDAVNSTIEFANKNAQILKNESEWRIKVKSEYIDKIQNILGLWKSLDRDAVVNMLRVPSAAVNYGEYDEESGKTELTLAHRTLKVDMDKEIATALAENPNAVSVNYTLNFEVADLKLKVTHQYVYSMGDKTCSVKFVDVEKLDEVDVIETMLEMLLPNQE